MPFCSNDRSVIILRGETSSPPSVNKWDIWNRPRSGLSTD